MAFQREVGSGTARATDYRDYLTKLAGFLTSQHVATVAINNGGTGGTYVVGDLVTLTHAGALLDAVFEVTTVSAGQITGLRIHNSGAFSNRLTGSVTVNAGGTGYSAGISNLYLEVQGGSARENAKVLATTNGSGVVTSATLIETGGAYSSAPSFPAATAIVGPSGTTVGSGCTVTLSTTGLIGTTGLAVTGGGGTGATVDITLAETGWSTERNANDYVENSVLDEKEVVLKGDATGLTNKPYVGWRTGTDTVGIDTRYAVQHVGFPAYNPAIDFTSQVQHSPGPSGADEFADSGSYLIFPQNLSNEVDFWFSADDLHAKGAININPAANTDDGVYEHHYTGFGDRAKTESEDPYPLVIFASSRDFNADPTTSSGLITNPAEARVTSGSGPFWVYFPELGAWNDVLNNTGGTVVTVADGAFPFGIISNNVTGGNPGNIVAESGSIGWHDNCFKRDRSSPNRVMRPVPGSTPKIYRWPIVTARKLAQGEPNESTDSVRVQLRGMFAVFNTDPASGTGARITNFSEDFLSEGTYPTADSRWRVFHSWDLTERYQYVAIEENV
jgi:hypothetical protein